jgi:hypothetical protein
MVSASYCLIGPCAWSIAAASSFPQMYSSDSEIFMENSTEDNIRKFGRTAGCAMYVHTECVSRFLEALESEGNAVTPDSLVLWQYDELMAAFGDITSCDQCRKPFEATDKGYMSGWVSSKEDLAILKRIKAEGGA